MTIKEVTPDQYAALPLKHTHVFNTAAFSRLNAAKAERLHFLVFEEEGKPRYGITLGEREGWLLSPFSAPFGGFSYCKTPHIESLDAAAQMLADYAHNLGFRMRISLPPLFYAPQFLAETAAVLSRRSSATHIELNYHSPYHALPTTTGALHATHARTSAMPRSRSGSLWQCGAMMRKGFGRRSR